MPKGFKKDAQHFKMLQQIHLRGGAKLPYTHTIHNWSVLPFFKLILHYSTVICHTVHKSCFRNSPFHHHQFHDHLKRYLETNHVSTDSICGPPFVPPQWCWGLLWTHHWGLLPERLRDPGVGVEELNSGAKLSKHVLSGFLALHICFHAAIVTPDCGPPTSAPGILNQLTRAQTNTYGMLKVKALTLCWINPAEIQIRILWLIIAMHIYNTF